MDNIVSSFEEIELTEAELDVIYGAQGIEDVAELFSQSGTRVVVAGTSVINTTSLFAGTFDKTLS
jgi:hypothetical protein